MYYIITGSHYLTSLVVVLRVLYFILCWVMKMISDTYPLMRDGDKGRQAWLAFLSTGIILAGFTLHDVNVCGNVGNYDGLTQYLMINDDWETCRWYIRRIGMESYKKFLFKQKTFSAGSDIYGAVIMENHYNEMVMRYGESFDSVHNEYLQYSVMAGLAGLVAYLALLITSVRKMVRLSGKRLYVTAITSAVVCHTAQAAANISVPIVTLVTLMLLAAGVFGEGEANKEVP